MAANGAEPQAEVTLLASQAETFGIQTEPAWTETITRTIHAVATVVPDESRISHVHTRDRRPRAGQAA